MLLYQHFPTSAALAALFYQRFSTSAFLTALLYQRFSTSAFLTALLPQRSPARASPTSTIPLTSDGPRRSCTSGDTLRHVYLSGAKAILFLWEQGHGPTLGMPFWHYAPSSVPAQGDPAQQVETP